MAARDVTAAQGLAYPVPARRQRAEVDAGQLRRKVEAAGLIVLMAIGSIALWTAVPVAGLWLASQFTESFTQPSTASAVMTMLGIPALMALTALTGKGLAMLERRYMRVTGTTRKPQVPAYRRSISDSKPSSETTVLEALMVSSVLVAGLMFTAWFVLFAGSSLLP
jgi:hypothetical protein